MEQLKRLFKRVAAQGSQLVITDELTGAGYIVDADDNVFARWTSRENGIRLLDNYLESYRRHNDISSELY